MAQELSREDLRRYARLGAMRRLEEIRREEARIRSAFPELFGGRGVRQPGKPGAAPKARKRTTMTPAMRKVVSERMKKYWAGRRKAKNG